MSKSKPITTTLFNFKTFRSPDKIEFTEKSKFFIHHPDISKSKFNRCPLPNLKDTPKQNTLTEFIGSFKPANSYKEIRAINPALYDYSCLLMQQKKNDSSKKQLNAKLPTPLKEGELIKIWDELGVQIATQKSKTVRQACIQLIITQHYLHNNKTLDLSDISKLTIVIPEIVINCFKPWYFSECGGKLFGVHNLGIQEYRRVEQTLCCYVPGEISHIENIMAKEYKEKSTRNLLRTEYSTESTTETEIENLSDTTTADRNEISSEIAKELQKDKSFNISGSVTYSKDSKVYGNIAANVSSGYTSNNSSSLSNTEAKNYSKEITERALERVVQKTTEKRTYRMIKEYEENNKHGFDNRSGGTHVTGVYRWVDKIYDNQLVNYGKRLMFEADLPHPALFYKKALEWKAKKQDDIKTPLTPPKTLDEFGIKGTSAVNAENAQNAANYFGTIVDAFEQRTQYLDVSFQNDTSHDDHTQTDTQSNIVIPDGFVADLIEGTGSFEYRAVSGSSYLNLAIGGYNVYRGDYKDNTARTDNFNISIDPNPDLAGLISFAISYRKIFKYSGTLRIKCISSPALFSAWQSDTFDALQTAYQKKLDEYNEEQKLQQAALEGEKDQAKNENYSNPALNRLIEERELKRICIEMMSKPYCYDVGKNFNECKTYSCTNDCGENESMVPQVIQNEELEKYVAFIKFFETAFQWEIFSYIFYPYYYNPKCEWSELMQLKNDDTIFEAFLQSGMAKVLVPVRPQYEKAVMHYMETGEIYTDGDLVPETEDDRYLSLLTELGNQDEIKVEGTWQTRVPSTLTIIQAKSTYFEDEKGLPCCDKQEDDDIVFKNDKDITLESIKPE
ncbi:MAG: hypothetical protein K0M56_08105 [Kaistella sp.]|nr:hypothetical protein [Kaistella sp.]